MTIQVLDHVDNLELSGEAVSRYGNELRSLDYLAQGLWFLFRQVQQTEEMVTEAVGRKRQVMMFGNAPALSNVPQGLIACSFHWYAVSACNYVRTTGWLANDQDSRKASERVLPAVKLWRDKVGAHFARVGPRSEDTPADLAASVMFPVGFVDDAFSTNPFTLSLSSGGEASSSRTDMQWSLTRTHRALASRYWPDTPISDTTT